MKTSELIQNITELKISINSLDDENFIQEQWLTNEDILLVKEELKKQIASNKEEMHKKIDFLLGKRRKELWFIGSNNIEIQELQKSNESHTAEITKMDNYIHFVCKALDADTKNKISLQNGVVCYSKKKRRTEIDTDRLPYSMFRIKEIKTELDPINDFEKIREVLEENKLNKDWSHIRERNITAKVIFSTSSLEDNTKSKLLKLGLIDDETLSKKKEERVIADITAWYESLSDKEKEKYKDVIKVIDNETQLKIN